MYALAILLILFLAIYILTVVMLTRSSVNQTKIRGPYAVQTGTTATTLFVCGTQKNQECTFSATTLNDAIQICNDNLNICRQFTYSGTTMKFVDNNTVAGPFTLYLYQPNL